MRYVIKREDAYLKFCTSRVEPTEAGRRQFFEFETHGIAPESPDPFYLCLSEGRKWMDWMRNELKDAYKRYLDGDLDSWYGWYMLHLDWKGELHILKLLMNWCVDRDGNSLVPPWVFDEGFRSADEQGHD